MHTPGLKELQSAIRNAMRDPAMKNAEDAEIYLPISTWKLIAAEIKSIAKSGASA